MQGDFRKYDGTKRKGGEKKPQNFADQVGLFKSS